MINSYSLGVLGVLEVGGGGGGGGGRERGENDIFGKFI